MSNDPDSSGPTDEARKAGAADVDEAPSVEEMFKTVARLLFGSDWQREAARALGRDETVLARFLLGERAAEDGEQLYADMLALMRRRAAEIIEAADRFAATLAAEVEARRDTQKSSENDQGI
jgi:hypothetical protein